MTREHVILQFCDVHTFRAPDDQPVEAANSIELAVTTPVALAAKPHRIDVCDECLSELSGLLQVVDEYGVSPEDPPRAANGRKPITGHKPANTADPGVCPLCSQHFEWVATHIGSLHKLNAESQKIADDQYRCPACEVVVSTGRALSQHATSTHATRLPLLIAQSQASASTKPKRPRKSVS